MKKFIVTMIAIVMALSLVACGKSDPTPADQTNTPVATSTATELYVKTDKSGNVTVVDKDGKVADGYTVDKDGNVLDKAGQIAVAADKVVAYAAPTTKTVDKENKAESKNDSKQTAAPESKSESTTSSKADSKSSNSASSDSSATSSGSTSKPSSGSSSTSTGSGNTSKPTQPSKPSEPAKPSQPSKPTHTHSYSSKTVAPTCSSDGYTVHTCSCGDSYKDSYKDALGHDWKAQYKNVTVDDYETAKIWRCSSCDSDITNVLKNNTDGEYGVCPGCKKDPTLYGYYSSYEEVKVGSHTEKELTGYTCTRCGATK